MPPKASTSQLSLDVDTYTQPDSVKDKRISASEPLAKSRQNRKIQAPIPESKQPFLPGLSRRGRPRSPNPVPPTLRATQSRQRRLESGSKRIELFLEPAVASDLERLVEHFKVARSEIISRLIIKTAKRLSSKQD